MSLTAEHSIFSESDRLFMNQALEQGRRALPGCQPNPPVGCVIVRHGVVVASGYTQPPGQHHAEAMALSRLAPSPPHDADGLCDAGALLVRGAHAFLCAGSGQFGDQARACRDAGP